MYFVDTMIKHFSSREWNFLRTIIREFNSIMLVYKYLHINDNLIGQRLKLN